MKIVVGIILGFLSGFLAYIGVAMLTISGDPGSAPSLAPALIAFALVWIASAWWMTRGARRISGVFRRGFILGAAEWIAMIPLGFIVTARNTSALHGSTLSNAVSSEL